MQEKATTWQKTVQLQNVSFHNCNHYFLIEHIFAVSDFLSYQESEI